MMKRLRRHPGLLALAPLITYAIAYLYLAWYHGTPLLLGTVVHESGRYTLLENTFYAPHFLGHIPVLVTLALLMAGSYRSFAFPPVGAIPRDRARTAGVLVVFLAASFVLSIFHWGGAETWEFVTQQRQRPDLVVPGGSWLLHLPSTLALIFGLPLTVVAARWFFDRPTDVGTDGAIVFGLGVVSIIGITCVVVPQPWTTVTTILGDPRYLGHGVRELATFPLTYFPLPLAWWFTAENAAPGFRWNRALVMTVLPIALTFTGIMGYEVIVPLNHGIGDLAQQPAFAHDGGLSIPYLLASHFFEHFLDTIFFALMCLLLMPSRPRPITLNSPPR